MQIIIIIIFFKRQTNKQKLWKMPKAKMTSSVQIGLLEKAPKVPGPLSCCGAKITGELTQPPESQLEENGPDGLNG